ncbi:DsbA family protein [Parvibaculum sp.]|jgi:2-hydroxychromene-2-carboxylate isomerase|uniref:2-hydroxychromene-2-carboxylate isomerase n=1 Tax=Parvibaculum sp. TaxID=2024848 RepID=UPI000C5A8560|nr:DsbA family protein [Parvibaculum sp.]MAM93155.1 disulfide bond formation protein DsbA [Parvibaculum sp.]
MTLEYDLFWSFRSPYSYLVTKRLVEFERDYDVKANVRPVYPIAVRIPGFFKQVNPMWPPYLLKDTVRIAQMEGLPYAWPSPDPIVMDLASGEVPEEQPYIRRLTRAGVLAAEQGKGLPFLYEISTVIFGGVKNWHEGDHLRDAAKRAGLDMDALDAQAEKETDRIEAVITANEAAQKAAGHWGVPLMVYEGEPFFGQDRLDHLKWRLEQKGLKKRG